LPFASSGTRFEATEVKEMYRPPAETEGKKLASLAALPSKPLLTSVVLAAGAPSALPLAASSSPRVRIATTAFVPDVAPSLRILRSLVDAQPAYPIDPLHVPAQVTLDKAPMR